MSVQHIALVLEASGLCAQEKAVLTAFCNHTDAAGKTFAGEERLMREAGMPRTTFQRWRAALVKRNLLISKRKGRKGGGRTSSDTWVNLQVLQEMRDPWFDGTPTERQEDESPFAKAASNGPASGAKGGGNGPASGAFVGPMGGAFVGPASGAVSVSDNPQSDPSVSSSASADRSALESDDDDEDEDEETTTRKTEPTSKTETPVANAEGGLVQRIAREHGATVAEVEVMLSAVRREGRIENLRAWAGSVRGREDIGERLATLRAAEASREARGATSLRATERREECTSCGALLPVGATETACGRCRAEKPVHATGAGLAEVKAVRARIRSV